MSVYTDWLKEFFYKVWGQILLSGMSGKPHTHITSACTYSAINILDSYLWKHLKQIIYNTITLGEDIFHKQIVFGGSAVKIQTLYIRRTWTPLKWITIATWAYGYFPMFWSEGSTLKFVKLFLYHSVEPQYKWSDAFG